MKKIVTLFTIVTLIVALSSCNGGTKSTKINEDTMVVSEDPTLVVDSASILVDTVDVDMLKSIETK